MTTFLIVTAGVVVVWMVPAVALLAVRRGGFRDPIDAARRHGFCNPIDAQLEREPWRRQ